jgi:hypothetical protein
MKSFKKFIEFRDFETITFDANQLKNNLIKAMKERGDIKNINLIKSWVFTDEYFSDLGFDIRTLLNAGIINRDPHGYTINL